MHCSHLYIRDDREAENSGMPKRECTYREKPWEKMTDPKVCPDDGVCPYTEDGEPVEDHGGGCGH